MPAATMAPRHVVALKYLRAYTDQTGRPPTLQEVMADFRFVGANLLAVDADQPKYVDPPCGQWAPLTKRQYEILEFVNHFRGKHGYSPTIREIGAAFGISSPNGVMCHLKAWSAKAY